MSSFSVSMEALARATVSSFRMSYEAVAPVGSSSSVGVEVPANAHG